MEEEHNLETEPRSEMEQREIEAADLQTALNTVDRLIEMEIQKKMELQKEFMLPFTPSDCVTEKHENNE